MTRSKPRQQRVVGFFVPVWQEISGRWVAGITRYIERVPNLDFRDFRFLDHIEIGAAAAPPPWLNKVDGMVVAFGLHDAETAAAAMAWLERGEVPVVSLAWDWSHPRLPIVATDIAAVLEHAADYLIERGLRHFALIDDVVGRKHNVTGRAFSQRLAQRGYKASEGLLSFRAEGTQEDLERMRGEENLIQLLREAPKPLGVFAVSDPQARAVCALCRELGLEVPGEVAILGCGDLDIARLHSPPLSSVRTPAEQVGYGAVKLLHELMDGGVPPEQSLLIPPVGVVERESTCATRHGFGDVRRALEFIRQHACEGLQVSDLVDHLRVCRRTLEKHFTEHLGHSPGQEIQQVRLAMAKSLLADTTLSISRVAELAGFQESSSLTTFIRKQTGLTPSQLRKRKDP